MGTLGILQSNEDEVTEIVEDDIRNAGSPFEKWLHRDLLLAGLCLSDDVGVSLECENGVIEQLAYLYLTTPYNALRSAISTVLNASRNSHVAAKVTKLAITAIHGQEIGIASLPASPTSPLLATSESLQSKLSLYGQRFLKTKQESYICLIRLHLIAILYDKSDAEKVVWNDFIFTALSDPDWQVRQTAVFLLELLDSEKERVSESLNLIRKDPDPYVREAAANVLARMENRQAHSINPFLTDPTDSHFTMENTKRGISNEPMDHLDDLLLSLANPQLGIRKERISTINFLTEQQPDIAGYLRKILSDPFPTALIPTRRLDEYKEEISTILLARQLMLLGTVDNGQPQVTETLLTALSDHHANIRIAAISALHHTGHRQAVIIDNLRTLLTDSEPTVRSAAAQALKYLDTEHLQGDDASESTSASDSKVGLTIASTLEHTENRQLQGHEGILNTLLDPGVEAEIRQTIIDTLTVLPIDTIAIGRSIEEALLRYEQISCNELTAYEFVNTIFLALQSVIGQI